jgi:two-component system, LytTR family, sensor kinase
LSRVKLAGGKSGKMPVITIVYPGEFFSVNGAFPPMTRLQPCGMICIFDKSPMVRLKTHYMNRTTDSLHDLHHGYFKKNHAAAAILLFWVVVAFIVFIQATIAMHLNHEPSDWYTTFIISCGWLLWSLLTPVIVRMVNKMDTRNIKLHQETLIYPGLGIVFVAMHIVLEMILFNLTLVNGNISFKLPDYIIYHIHTQFLVFFFIVFVVKGIGFYKRYLGGRLQEEKLNYELSNARLQALKMQLNPHFLFNTHHSIISLMTKNENKTAISMLMKLSDFLRITLSNNNQLSTLGDEIKLMKFYLDIQQVRFGDKLTVKIDMADSIADAIIPTFILQPLIENSVIHGIAPYTSPATLSVSCSRTADTVEIEVSDTGGGIHAKSMTEGIGLKNTKSRLKELYNDKAGMTVQSHPVKGTVTKIWIPFSTHNTLLHAND